MTEFKIHVHVGEAGVGTLEWNGRVDEAALIRAVGLASDDALLAHGLRRLEVALPAADRLARRAVVRAGFRLEGVRREALAQPDGTFGDIWQFARLASDQVHGPNGFSGVMNTITPKKRLIAHVLYRDDAGRFLLCETRFKADWELPGGIVEPGETPRAAATREVGEELGEDWPIGDLLVADWMPPYLGWDDAIELIFAGAAVAESDLATIRLDPHEIVQARLCTLAEAADLVTALSHRRLAVALGLAAGEFAYLEDGRRPCPPGQPGRQVSQ